MATIPRNYPILVMKTRSLGATTTYQPVRPGFKKPRCPATQFLVVRMYDGVARYVMTYKTLRGALRYRQRMSDRDTVNGNVDLSPSVRIFDLNQILADGLAEVPDVVYQVDLFAGVRLEEEA